MCCSSTEQQATGYVLMAGRSEYLITCNDPLGSGVNHSNNQNRRDTDSLLRQVRDKVRSRRTSSGDSADHSSEQDSSENCQSVFFILNPYTLGSRYQTKQQTLKRDPSVPLQALFLKRIPCLYYFLQDTGEYVRLGSVLHKRFYKCEELLLTNQFAVYCTAKLTHGLIVPELIQVPTGV